MSILSAENLSLSYGEKVLFNKISFTINQEKTGLIGLNGTGKSTLLKVIAGIEKSYEGEIKASDKITIEYLPQDPDFQDDTTVIEQIFKSDTPIIKAIRDYEDVLYQISKYPNNEELQRKLTGLIEKIDRMNGWDLESQIKTILTKLGITEFDKNMSHFSGGQRKRIALASSLLNSCDLLILDEPTNHLDNEMIDWLETYLKARKGALIMITHDRYFLDRVSDRIFELSNGDLFSYDGNYSYYMEKKLERTDLDSARAKKLENLYKKELAWMRRGAKARTTKQKARIQRFDTIKENLDQTASNELEISSAFTRLGKKIIEIHEVSKSYGENKVIDSFSYTFQRTDRIGIIGKNGAGKSTLLNLITQKIKPDLGKIEVGDTVKIGYFSQESEDLKPEMRAIDYVKETAEFVTDTQGRKITVSKMMENFLFTPAEQYTMISKLSGGEKRRLFLLKILMNSPNVLVLDEPTNDLDIDTLKVLENYIDEFSGPVIAVSHDRYFLDRISNKIFVFGEGGLITQHTGNYFDYINESKTTVSEQSSSDKIESATPRTARKKNKLSFKEQLEYDSLHEDMVSLEQQIAILDLELSKNSTDFVKLQELAIEKETLENKLLEKLEREEYLNELIRSFNN
ncbi:ABC-F family ATP-binding cassette domain-containing protein [Alkalibacter mobilis]|uniref:ABC-F family ATP-binding cassette domain-containing protein n=1 Tax=Alkalibacter mobilis TaxID=2787712 RepID=UPI00189DE7A8|nr:ABC-F family ATP-binding cassette domain-containing protein [Alkalibacter mobilis]MBF7097520.1 ABC-F family ATP-binding cassette domain-containing protein [Alkalibacter mobilis]